tara:strand:+ start:214 stop:477 length:264 start_codon:yes stop_codon:yes gene_type:complete
MDHPELNTNFLNVLREEAEVALKNGDKETAQALYKSLIRLSFPVVEAEVKQNPEIIVAIMAEACQEGTAGEAAQVLLDHLHKKGLVK